jgi:ferredoxin-NADP reductase
MARHRARVGSSASMRLLYSSRSWDEVIYRDELETLGAEVVFTLTREQPADWQGYARRVDDELLREVAFPAAEEPRVYVCGSTRFVDAAADGLVRLGYDPAWIRTERFGATG